MSGRAHCPSVAATGVSLHHTEQQENGFGDIFFAGVTIGRKQGAGNDFVRIIGTCNRDDLIERQWASFR